MFGDPVVALADLKHVVQRNGALLRQQGRDWWVAHRSELDLMLAIGEANRAGAILNKLGHHHRLAVPRARWAQLTGDPALARGTAAEWAWEDGVTRRDRAELLLIKAHSALQMRDEMAARRTFERAYGLCESMESLLPYAALPPRTLDRLLELSRLNLPVDDRERLARCRQVYPGELPLVELTRRETTVLQAMTEHETLTEVAQNLTVSLNTVKKQVASIYRKLGVHDRAAALLEAQRMGLISRSW